VSRLNDLPGEKNHKEIYRASTPGGRGKGNDGGGGAEIGINGGVTSSGRWSRPRETTGPFGSPLYFFTKA